MRQTRSRRLLCVLAAGAVAATTAAAAPAHSRAGAPLRTVYVAISPYSLPRTAFVRARDCLHRPHACVNGVDSRELVYLIRGALPTRPTSATVLTDTNCAPDMNGISHCSNILRLPSGRRITVRHDHSMMNDPCLAPGERVNVRPLR